MFSFERAHLPFAGNIREILLTQKNWNWILELSVSVNNGTSQFSSLCFISPQNVDTDKNIEMKGL